MKGVAAVRAVLKADATLTALVPASRIVGGMLPQGTNLPAISLDSLSVVDRPLPNPGADRFVRERVQATIHASNWDSAKAVKRAVRNAGDSKFPTVSGISNVTIHLAGSGPEIENEEASINLEFQDFSVTYSEAR